MSESNSNLMREVRLFENHAEREQVDNMGELYAVLKTLESLEKLFYRDLITADEYKTECQKLLESYKTAVKLVPGSEADVTEFCRKWRLNVPLALERVRDGCPLTVKDDRGNMLKNVAAIVEIFITCCDQLKLEVRSVDELYPNLDELYNTINAMIGLPDNFDGKIAVKKWRDKLYLASQQNASEQLTEEEARQLIFELESAYTSFTRFLQQHR